MSFSSKQAHQHLLLGAVFAFIAAGAFSGKAILVKLAYRYAVDPVTLLTLRMLFSVPFFMVMAIWSARDARTVNLNRRDWSAIVILGLLGYYLGSLLDFWGLSYISASLERLTLFLYPTLVVVLSALLLRRRIRRVLVICPAMLQRQWQIELTRKSSVAKTTVSTVPGPGGRWFLEDVDVVPLKDFCR